MKKLLFAAAALTLMATASLAGTNPDPERCHKLTANYVGAPEYQCTTVSFGGGGKTFCSREKNANSDRCNSCSRDTKKS